MLHRLTATALRFEGIGPFDLTVFSGQCLAVTGPSGAGKSLLLRMLADLLPHEGTCSLDDTPRSQIAGPAWRKRVRYCAAEPGWWAPKVADHFLDPNAARAACASLSLDPGQLDVAPDRLSTGERQRFAILRAIEDAPDFLLLDEPSSALDQASTLLLEALLMQRQQAGMGLVLVSHDAAQVARMAQASLAVVRS